MLRADSFTFRCLVIRVCIFLYISFLIEYQATLNCQSQNPRKDFGMDDLLFMLVGRPHFLCRQEADDTYHLVCSSPLYASKWSSILYHDTYLPTPSLVNATVLTQY
jgi:hypothetical protein